MNRRLGAILALAVALAGCGAGDPPSTERTATVWITRGRGAHVLRVKSVPAGITAMQALKRVADVDTRYGGRFVQSINGLAGSLTGRRDWFYFVNGYEADRSAVEYRLRPGDVEWWDYRSWRDRMREPVVIGSFPEPFLHGFGGLRRPTVVRYSRVELRPGAREIGILLRAESIGPVLLPSPEDANVFIVMPRAFGDFTITPRGRDWGPGDPVVVRFGGDAKELARNPRLVRFRYEGLP